MTDTNLRIGIITVSDRAARGERPDASSPALGEAIHAQGWQVARQTILPDDFVAIRDLLITWADAGDLDVILTTGGTGFTRRDVTPEATLSAIDKVAYGIPEAMRATSLQFTPHAMLSRAVAGIRKQTLVINLPGSPKAAVENLQVVLAVLVHAVQLLHGDQEAESGH